MKQVLLIVLLLIAVLAGYLFFFEPETLDKLMGKEAVGVEETTQPKTRKKSTPKPKKTTPEKAKSLIPAPAILELPQDGMRYYVNGKSVAGNQVELPPGEAVLLGFRDGSYRHEVLELKSGQKVTPQAAAQTVQQEAGWDTFQGGSLRSGHVQAGKRQSLDVAWKGHMGHKVQSSPIISEGVAYFSSNQHLLNAVELTGGKLLWSQGKVGSSVTPILNGQFGFAGDNLGAFTGFRLKDGKPKGTARLDSYAVSLGRFSEEAFLAVTRSNTVFSIQTRKGVFGKLPLKVNWDVEVPELRGSQAAPLFTADSVIFQTEGYGLLAMRLTDGSRLWPQVNNVSTETFDPDAQSFVRDDIFLTPTPAADKKHVYGLNDDALVAHTLDRGDEVWRQTVEPRPSSSLSTAFGMVIYGAGDGTIRAHSTTDGQPIYTASVGTKPVFASPIIFDDKLLVATGEGKVLLLDAFNGTILAEDKTLAGSGIDATPAVTAAGILAINRRGDMVFFR